MCCAKRELFFVPNLSVESPIGLFQNWIGQLQGSCLSSFLGRLSGGFLCLCQKNTYLELKDSQVMNNFFNKYFFFLVWSYSVTRMCSSRSTQRAGQQIDWLQLKIVKLVFSSHICHGRSKHLFGSHFQARNTFHSLRS